MIFAECLTLYYFSDLIFDDFNVRRALTVLIALTHSFTLSPLTGTFRADTGTGTGMSTLPSANDLTAVMHRPSSFVAAALQFGWLPTHCVVRLHSAYVHSCCLLLLRLSCPVLVWPAHSHTRMGDRLIGAVRTCTCVLDYRHRDW